MEFAANVNRVWPIVRLEALTNIKGSGEHVYTIITLAYIVVIRKRRVISAGQFRLKVVKVPNPVQ